MFRPHLLCPGAVREGSGLCAVRALWARGSPVPLPTTASIGPQEDYVAKGRVEGTVAGDLETGPVCPTSA